MSGRYKYDHFEFPNKGTISPIPESTKKVLLLRYSFFNKLFSEQLLKFRKTSKNTGSNVPLTHLLELRLKIP